MKRICIYTSDIVALTGRSENSARKLLRQIRAQVGKPKGAIVTIEEFCQFTKIKSETVEEIIK